MKTDVASTVADLVARFGADAQDEAHRQLTSACDDDRGRDAQFWISVIFHLARTRPLSSAAA